MAKWGKGYAWNPVAFSTGRRTRRIQKRPWRGFTWPPATVIRSFAGPLKTVAFNPVILPVYGHVNGDFGAENHVNAAAKLYVLVLRYRHRSAGLHRGQSDRALWGGLCQKPATNWRCTASGPILTNVDTPVDHGTRTGFSPNRRCDELPAGRLRYLTPPGHHLHSGVLLQRDRVDASTEVKTFVTFVDGSYATFLRTAGTPAVCSAPRPWPRGPMGGQTPCSITLFRASQKEPSTSLFHAER